MDEASGDLKQALPNDCEPLEIHVEVHQKSNRLVLYLIMPLCYKISLHTGEWWLRRQEDKCVVVKGDGALWDSENGHKEVRKSDLSC